MKHSVILALLVGATGVLFAQAPTFNSLRHVYYKHHRTNPEEALKITAEMEKLPNLKENEKNTILRFKLGASYNMKDPKPCAKIAEEIIAMPNVPADIKASAYFLGGIREGNLGNLDKFLNYMVEGEKIAPDPQSKYNLMIYHITALTRLKRNQEALAQFDKCLAFAKEQNNRDGEYRAYYVAVQAMPGNKRCAFLEELLKAEDFFQYPYAQHIARTLLHSYYSRQPEKAKALCERVLKESKRVVYPDFKKKLDELSK